MRAHGFILTVSVLSFGTTFTALAQPAPLPPGVPDYLLDLPSGSDPAFNIPPDWKPGQALAPRTPPVPAPPERLTPPEVFTDVVSPEDYPPDSLRLGEQGVVRARFLVTERGAASDCTIDSISGHSRLDEVACGLVGRWNFKPRSDGGTAATSFVTINLVFGIFPPRIPDGDPALNIPAQERLPLPALATGQTPSVLERFTPPQVVTSHAVTVDDYPAASIQFQEQGTIGLAFIVSETGDVSECAVVLSSGYPRLDAAARAMVVNRWKYKPARLDGKTTATLQTANVVYQLR